MQVTPSQLVPGCIVLKNVYGKMNHPILPANTTVTDQHIIILKKFLISHVEVAPKLASGSPFTPAEPEKEEEAVAVNQPAEKEPGDFPALYRQTVELYKILFTRWQGNTAIDISVVRKLIFPLLDIIEYAEEELADLYRYSTKQTYFYHHSVSTAILSAYLAKQHGFSDWKQVGLAGFLADCGMAKVDAALFEKPAPLTSGEYQEIKTHPTYSYRLVEKIPSLSLKVKLGILQHHEKLDGSGYPLGVKKEKIHPYAKVIAVADRYHAMTADRIYQEKKPPYKVMEELLEEQLGKYDLMMVQTLVHNLVNIAVGTKVKLSDKQEAEVVFLEKQLPLRPIVKLTDTQEIISLKGKSDLYIETML